MIGLPIRKILTVVVTAAFCAAATSCFNVDTTRKITLSKSELKEVVPSDEELLLADLVEGAPLGAWIPGKMFLATDNRAVLIFDSETYNGDPDNSDIKGKPLIYRGTETRMEPDGSQTVLLLFDCEGNTYRYPTRKSIETAATDVRSNSLPMIIDMASVSEVGNRLSGKSVWTRSKLWYASDGSNLDGRKFVEVRIDSVTPGDAVFPLKVWFSDKEGTLAFMKMNYGSSGTDSRSFGSLFSLSDIRKRYPRINDRTWQMICNGSVEPGMTKEECRLALGNPPESLRGHDYSRTLDLWTYPDGTTLYFQDGVLARKGNVIPEK